MSVIVGSTAIKHHFPDFPREPKDLDRFDSYGDDPGPAVDSYSHPTLDGWIGGWDRIATPDELYTVKLSHVFWELKNGSWEKHVFDMRFLKRRGAELIPDLHSKLYK